MPYTIDQASALATASATAAAMSTITEVSRRWPCQVMATSPGRSASHTAPNAISAIRMRYRITRIMMNDDWMWPSIVPRARCAPAPRWGEGARSPQPEHNPSPHPSPYGRGSRASARPASALASLAQPRERIGGEAAARIDGGLPRLNARGPGLRAHAGVRRELTQFGRRAGNVAARRLRLGAHDDRAGIAARGRIDAAHLDELLRIRLQPRQHALARRRGRRLQRGRKLGELARERRRRRHAA